MYSPVLHRAEHGSSADVNFLSDLKSVINLNAKVPHSALDLRVTEEQLNGPQVSRSPIDQRCFGATHGVGGEFERVKPDAADPLSDETRILPGGQVLIRAAPPREQPLARHAVGGPR